MPSNVIQFTILGVDKFSGVVGKISGSLSSVIKKTAGVAASITAASGAIFYFTKKVTEAEDRAAKFSKRLGIAVEELTALEFAGNRSGVAVNQLDMSIQRLTRRAAEAAQGMGEAQGALKELGIDAKTFSDLGIEDKMALLAKQLEGVTNAGDRTRIAFKLFDSEGVSMLQMLGDGEEAFRGLTGEAREFGAVIDKQAAANAEKFQDSLTNMTTVMGGVFRSISDEIVPIVTAIMDKVTAFFIRNRDTILEWSRVAIKAFWYVYVMGERVFEGLGKTIEQFTSWEGIKDLATNFANAFGNIFESAVAVFTSIGNFIINIFKVAFAATKAIAKWAWENIKAVFSKKEGPSLAELLFTGIPEATASAREELSSSTKEMADTVVSNFSIIGTSIADILNINLEGIDERVNFLSENFKTFGEVAEESIQPIIETTTTLQSRLSELWDKYLLDQGSAFEMMTTTMFDTMTSAIDSISDGIAGVIVDGGKMLDVIRDVAKSVLKEVISMFIKMGIQRVATALLSKTAVAGEASAEGAKAIGLTFANTMASWAGAPWPISMAAPAMAAANMAAASAGMAAGAATGAGLGAAIGAAHGGLTNVPNESTYLLQKGERVLSPNQNKDFTNFISDGNGSGLQIASLVIHVLENATNAESLLNMDPKEMKEIVADKIITAMDELHNDGIRPKYAEGM